METLNKLRQSLNIPAETKDLELNSYIGIRDRFLPLIGEVVKEISPFNNIKYTYGKEGLAVLIGGGELMPSENDNETRGEEISDGPGLGYAFVRSGLNRGQVYLPKREIEAPKNELEHVVIANLMYCITPRCGCCGHSEKKDYYAHLFLALTSKKLNELR